MKISGKLSSITTTLLDLQTIHGDLDVLLTVRDAEGDTLTGNLDTIVMERDQPVDGSAFYVRLEAQSMALGVSLFDELANDDRTPGTTDAQTLEELAMELDGAPHLVPVTPLDPEPEGTIYPEHAKAMAAQTHREAALEFLGWLSDQGIHMHQWAEDTATGAANGLDQGEWTRVERTAEQLVADWLEIDQTRLAEEKRAMLAAARKGRQP